MTARPSVVFTVRSVLNRGYGPPRCDGQRNGEEETGSVVRGSVDSVVITFSSCMGSSRAVLIV